MPLTLPHYTPLFLQKFWLTHGARGPIHRYDVYTTELSELTLSKGLRRQTALAGVDVGSLVGATRHSYEALCERFALLEHQTEAILDSIIANSVSADSIPIDRSQIDILLKYFAFLRFRNSPKYASVIQELRDKTFVLKYDNLEVYNDYSPHFTWHPFFKSIHAFLCSERRYIPPRVVNSIQPAMNHFEKFCWEILWGGDVYIGLASSEQEYILSECCFGTLDEQFGADDGNDSFFCPITPSLALYVIGSSRDGWPAPGPMSIQVDHESEIDIHLRNAMILSSLSLDPMPTSDGAKLYFSSLISITRSISSYEEFRCRDLIQFIDYSRLKQRCRQKYLQATVTKMLIVKGDIAVFDLTDDVEFTGGDPVAFGAFSDVWKGRWYDRMERKERVVAIKFLRQAMVQSAKAKLLRRLQAEVVTWHHLYHRNVSQLFGIVQSRTSIGMVSGWCKNGSIGHYLRDVNPGACRMLLLRQIASGVSYLHSFNPPIVHGDLKGGNILVDQLGQAIITDFGLSKVMSDLSDLVCSSFFAGSMRWMAPELIEALAADEERIPQVTTASDVYAFASVCLEIMTGVPPYPNRKNDQAVMFDIIRKVKPYWGSPAGWSECLGTAFGSLMDRCWDEQPPGRPEMGEVVGVLSACKSVTS
ncbi:kinase-like protein [Hymenopellis radicata]|nr:kinase-like protein [Hymenopellis radicata]